jgi:hypothetical protein
LQGQYQQSDETIHSGHIFKVFFADEDATDEGDDEIEPLRVNSKWMLTEIPNNITSQIGNFEGAFRRHFCPCNGKSNITSSKQKFSNQFVRMKTSSLLMRTRTLDQSESTLTSTSAGPLTITFSTLQHTHKSPKMMHVSLILISIMRFISGLTTTA